MSSWNHAGHNICCVAVSDTEAFICCTDCDDAFVRADSSFNEFLRQRIASHEGHNVVCVEDDDGVNVSVECKDCGEVIIDFDTIDD